MTEYQSAALLQQWDGSAVAAVALLAGCSATAKDPSTKSSGTGPAKSSASASPSESPASSPTAPAVVSNINKSQLTPDQVAKCDAFGLDSAIRTTYRGTTLTVSDAALGTGNRDLRVHLHERLRRQWHSFPPDLLRFCLCRGWLFQHPHSPGQLSAAERPVGISRRLGRFRGRARDRSPWE